MRELQDEGTLVAAAGHRHAAWIVRLGLAALQHRGHAGVGLAASDGSAVRGLRRDGPVHRALPGRTIDDLDGPIALGRLTGSPVLAHDGSGTGFGIDEPLVRAWRGGRFAVATTGRLTNGVALRQELLDRGHVLSGASDAELIAALIGISSGHTLVNRVVGVLHDLRGAFVLAVATEDRLIVARDTRGFRPLLRGDLGGATVFASEDTALRDLGCEAIAEVPPGEVVIADRHGAQSIRPFLRRPRLASLADVIALARDDARVEGLHVAEVRLALGRAVGQEHPATGAEVVVGLPGASLVAAGYAEATGRPLRPLLLDRGGDATSLAPADLAARLGRHTLSAAGVRGREVALVVPVLASGVSVQGAAQALRRAGARRIHLRVASPAITHVDPYGLALPPPEALAAVLHPTPDALATALDVDSAATLSLAGLRGAVPHWEAGWCDSAWSGRFVEPAEVSPDQLGLFDADGD